MKQSGVARILRRPAEIRHGLQISPVTVRDPTFGPASDRIAESVLSAVVKAEIGTRHISTPSWAASLALLDLSGECLIRLLRAGPW